MLDGAGSMSAQAAEREQPSTSVFGGNSSLANRTLSSIAVAKNFYLNF
jgi:hypothetical protein